MSVAISEIAQMSVAERIQLMGDIWDTIEVTAESLPLSEEQAEELDCRLEDLDQNPNTGSSWEEAKQRILHRK